MRSDAIAARREDKSEKAIGTRRKAWNVVAFWGRLRSVYFSAAHTPNLCEHKTNRKPGQVRLLRPTRRASCLRTRQSFWCMQRGRTDLVGATLLRLWNGAV